MSFKDLIEPECGGANPLMNLGRQVTRDVAFQDEGFSGARSAFIGSDNDLVKEFMGQIAPAPQSFRMDVLLKEMRDIDAQNFHQRQIVPGPPVIEEVNRSDLDWAKEFAVDPSVAAGSSAHHGHRAESKLTSIWSSSHLAPIEGTISDGPSNILYAKDFFDLNEPKSEEEQVSIRKAAGELVEVAYGHDPEKMKYSEVSYRPRVTYVFHDVGYAF